LEEERRLLLDGDCFWTFRAVAFVAQPPVREAGLAEGEKASGDGGGVRMTRLNRDCEEGSSPDSPLDDLDSHSSDQPPSVSG
jgi:hypothetical protein